MINQKKTKIIFIVVTLIVVFAVTIGFLFFQFGLVLPEQRKWEEKGTMAVDVLRSNAANPSTLHISDIRFRSNFKGNPDNEFYEISSAIDKEYYFCYITTSNFILKFNDEEQLYTIIIVPKSGDEIAKYWVGASSILDEKNNDTRLIKYIINNTEEIAKTDVSVFNKNKPKTDDNPTTE